MINYTSNNEIYAWHIGGANALFADGSVHFLTEGTSAQVIMALVTRTAARCSPPIIKRFGGGLGPERDRPSVLRSGERR